MKALKILSMVGLSAMMLAMTACSSSKSDAQVTAGANGSTTQQVELRVMWWGDQQRADITNAMLQKFQEKHPEIKIVPEFTAISGYFDKLNTELASGTAPDVFTLGSNILEYATKGVLLDLNPYVSKDLNTSDMSPTLNNVNTFNGKLAGISIGANAAAILANTDMFKKAGITLPTKDWTWDDFVKISEEFSQKLGKGYYGSYDYSGQMDQFGVYLTQRDKEIYNQDTKKLGYTADDLQNWFTMWDGMRKGNGIVTPELEVSAAPDDTSKSLVPKGQVAMEFIPTNQFAAYQSMTTDKLTLIPVPKGPNGNMISVTSSQNLSGYIKTQHPKEVAELMDFWINDPDAAKILGNDRGVPVSSKMRAVLKADASDTDKVVYDYLDLVATNNVKALYNVPGMNEFSQAMLKSSQNIAFGKTDIQKAAADFYTQSQQILQANLNAS